MNDDEITKLFEEATQGADYPAYMVVVDCQRCHENSRVIEITANLVVPCDNCGWPKGDLC